MGRPGGSKSGIVMFCILPYKGDPILIIHKLFNPFGFSTFCKDVRLFGTIPKTTDPGDLKYIPDTLSASPGYEQKIKIYSDPLEAIVESLKDKNINNSSLGLELAGLNINIQKMIF